MPSRKLRRHRARAPGRPAASTGADRPSRRRAHAARHRPFPALLRRALDVFEAPIPGSTAQLVDIGRLEAGDAVLRHADQRRADGLMRAAFGRQGDARRRRHQDEARILVAGVVQRIEAARDEGIVERPDRQQPFAEHAVAEAHRRQHQEQIVLRDAELDMLAALAPCPSAAPTSACAPGTRPRSACIANTPRRLTQGPEIGGDGDVGRGGDDALRQLAVGARDLRQDLAEALLRRHRALDRRQRQRADFDAVRAQPPRPLGIERRLGQQRLELALPSG